MMDISVYKPSEFQNLEQAWKQLESGEDMTVFQLYDWYVNINALYEQEHAKKMFRKWVYVLVSENGNPVMIAPIQFITCGVQYKCVGLSRGFYFIGRQGYSDYLNFIYKDFSKDAVGAVFTFLEETFHSQSFYFEQLLESTSLYKYIADTYKCKQYECYCAALILPETFEEYKNRLSKSTRQNIRTAINRQKRDNLCLTHEMIYQVDESMSKVLMDIRSQRLSDKQKKSVSKATWKGRIYGKCRSVVIRLFNAKHDVINQCCNPWCFLVKDGDKIASYFWGMRNDYRNEYYVILAGVDKEYAWYSPSLSHLYLYLQELYESNNKEIKVLDFTRGGERYKEDMGG